MLIGKSWHWAKDGFNLLRLQSAFLPVVESSPVDPVVNSALDQPYSYMGRGRQCYAFMSRDGRYVLKLPRLDQFGLPFWLRSLSFPFLESYREGKRAYMLQRCQFTMNSFQIAFSELQRETSVLYLHVNQTDSFHRLIQITDRIGRTYQLNLDKTLFILQEKTELMMPLVQQAIKKGDRKEAERILNAFLEVLESRSRKGIFNKDPTFLENFGFDGKKGIQVDIGGFYHKPGYEGQMAFEKSLSETAAHVHNWLAETNRDLQAWFDLRTEQILAR